MTIIGSKTALVFADGSTKVGVLTSTGQRWDGSPFALGYIRCRSKGAQVSLEGREVVVAGAKATVVGVPFASRIVGASAETKQAVSA